MKQFVRFLVVVGFVLCATASDGAASLAGCRPNIVLMITEDQGYGSVEQHGHPYLGELKVYRFP